MNEIGAKVRQSQVHLEHDHVAGKTIDFIEHVYGDGPGLFIAYTDGTFSIINAEQSYGESAYLANADFEIWDSEHSDIAIRMGLLNNEDYEAYRAEELRKNDELRRIARSKQYEALRAEFGDL